MRRSRGSSLSRAVGEVTEVPATAGSAAGRAHGCRTKLTPLFDIALIHVSVLQPSAHEPTLEIEQMSIFEELPQMTAEHAMLRGVGAVLHSPRFYDAIVCFPLQRRARRIRQRLLNLSRIRMSEPLLDVGCATGT